VALRIMGIGLHRRDITGFVFGTVQSAEDHTNSLLSSCASRLCRRNGCLHASTGLAMMSIYVNPNGWAILRWSILWIQVQAGR